MSSKPVNAAEWDRRSERERQIKNNQHFHRCYNWEKTLADTMGCGASNDVSRVRAPTTLEKKSVLPPINMNSKTKSPSAKSNGSTDSGIEDSEPPKSMYLSFLSSRLSNWTMLILGKAVSSKVPFTIDNLLVEHHQKSRLGHGETFDIVAAPKPGRLAPLKHVPRFVADSKQTTEVDVDLKTKIAAKLERASRKRRVSFKQGSVHSMVNLLFAYAGNRRRSSTSVVTHRLSSSKQTHRRPSAYHHEWNVHSINTRRTSSTVITTSWSTSWQHK